MKATHRIQEKINEATLRISDCIGERMTYRRWKEIRSILDDIYPLVIRLDAQLEEGAKNG